MFETVPYLYIMITAIVAITFLFLTTVLQGKARELHQEDFDKLHSRQAEIAEGVEDLRTKAAAIEKMLREVE